MIQNQQELLHLIAAGTVDALDGVQLLQTLKTAPEAIDKPNRQTCQPVQIASPHEPSGTQMPWLSIQVPIKN